MRVFGGVITKRNGLNVRQRKRGAVPHTFIQIGGKRMGVYLQSDERPAAEQPRGLPTYSFTTTRARTRRSDNELHELGSALTGRFRMPIHSLIKSLFFTDPAGNHYAVYTPSDSAKTHGAIGRMTGVGYIELEAPDVDASIDFYAKVLGFEVQEPHAKTCGRPR